MKCTEHSRANCPEPRCHVLAVCFAELPSRYLDACAWARGRGYSRWAHEVAIDGQWHREIATRLVSWMRWQGACSECGYVDSACGCWHGRRFAPELTHPLDAVMSHADRVAALGGVCRECMVERAEHGALMARMYDDGLLPSEVLRVWPPDQCAHDGTNWATVAALLDQMEEHGISLDVVHEWRPAPAIPSDPTSLTDGQLQEMADGYPFAWTDLRMAATAWEETHGRPITAAELDICCTAAAVGGMRPVEWIR